MFASSKVCIVESDGITPWRKSSLLFKDHLLQDQEVYPDELEARQKCQETCVDEQGALTKFSHKRKAYRGWKDRQVIY